jgi:murE/murF fusion protein
MASTPTMPTTAAATPGATWTTLPDSATALAWLASLAAPGAALTSDSRRLRAGDVFIAWPGLATDARAYVATALRAGAAACLVDAYGVEAFGQAWEEFASTIPRIAVLPGLKAAAGVIADAWLGLPSERLDVIASTGTNGKTSTAWWVAQALSLAGRRCGVIGTLGAGDPPTRLLPQGSVIATGYTTPDPVLLHGAFAAFVADGHAAVAIEASSIGLAEQRLAGARIKVALFTNFTPDHLDYHGDMASYWAAKRALFDWPGLQAAVINIDDTQGEALAEEFAAVSTGLPEVWTYSQRRAARLQATALHYTATGLAFTLVEDGTQSVAVRTHLIGDYNASNVLAVIGGLRALGLPLAQAAELAAEFTSVPGRMQRVALAASSAQQAYATQQAIASQPKPAAALPPMPEVVIAALPAVVVDYAHTPDALEQSLIALRPLATSRGGQLVCVFGCGGNRDAGKRPVMGGIAARLADRVIVTSDNPRHEEPQSIVEHILVGCVGASHVSAEVDRGLAIARAIAQAGAVDVLLLAGKGHEAEQEIAGVKRHFSDVEQAEAALLARARAATPLFTLSEAQALLASRGEAATLVGDGATAIHRVHSDTRSLRGGDLFVALKGERHDAHDFLGQAHAAGASAALAERGFSVDGHATSLPGLQVPDSLIGLQQLAAAWRAQQALPLIAVTGSNGKTTVTQMIAAILRAWQGAAAHATAGNYNNHIGVPLTLLALRREHRASVVELGMNHPGEIAKLAALARPTVALVNNAQREHQEFMSTVDAVARENGSVIAALPAGGVAVFPAGDVYTGLWSELAGARRVMRFWLIDDHGNRSGQPMPEAEVSGQASWRVDHWSLSMDTPAGSAELALHIAGRHNARNALAAAACALAAGCPLSAVVAGLQGFRPVNGRSQVERLVLPQGAITLVNDSYNANPDSVRAAVDMLAELPAPRWLLLGDMGEVGEQGTEFHREVGLYAREQGIEFFWTAGELAAHAAQAYDAAGPQGAAARHHADTAALVAALRGTAWPAAASVLVKGSRFMKMEQALAVLRECAATPASGSTGAIGASAATPATGAAGDNNKKGPAHAA